MNRSQKPSASSRPWERDSSAFVTWTRPAQGAILNNRYGRPLEEKRVDEEGNTPKIKIHNQKGKNNNGR